MPCGFNNGWTYTYLVNKDFTGMKLLEMLSYKYKHSSSQVWRDRINEGEIKLNEKSTKFDHILNLGDKISWERPPWEEPAVPANWEVIYDDGDLYVINKPSGLPVTPGGGFLKHTLTELLKSRVKPLSNGLTPKPVHRLGRYTSGVLMCARQKESRAQLSKILRNEEIYEKNCIKVYRGLAEKNSKLTLNESLEINIPIKEYIHPLTGKVWGSDTRRKIKNIDKDLKALEAFSKITLLEKRESCDLLEIIIKTGRPHQIRIHLAALGTPLIGDPLYLAKEIVSPIATPGQGGFLLHAYQIGNIRLHDREYSFEAKLPELLRKTIG